MVMFRSVNKLIEANNEAGVGGCCTPAHGDELS